MNKKKLLSIHIITYNHERYIKHCLDSIINQKTDLCYEIIISDDASNDNTQQILREYQEKYPNIISLLINTKNKGLIKNFYNSLDQCQGQYIINIDGDDYFNENSLNMIHHEIKRNSGIDIIEFEYDEYYQTSGKIVKHTNKFQRNISYDNYLYYAFIYKILPWAWCIKKSVLDKYLKKEELIINNINIEDYPISLELLYNQCTLIHINKSIRTYRRHIDSMSNINNLNYRIDFIKSTLNVSYYYYKKYKLPNKWLKSVKLQSNYSLMHTAGLYGDKTLGNKLIKQIFPNFKLKTILYYLLSQIKLLRKITSPFRKIN